eukprot:TRINITY_DN1136_c0_g1_i1.p1 TRINITY_DN1136_c0_g1~~TRINITY_DN1136_c0_g1_i1.p1  ORF type:complete len:641 (+),score=91.22 TRINITY_DN1136_c0_g1_i1:190-1923(+)
MCNSLFPQTQCDKSMNSSLCQCSGVMKNMDNSTVIVSKIGRTSIDELCFTSRMDTIFKSYYRNTTSWIGFGGMNSVYRMYPGVTISNCNNFDVRIEPWFVTATTGRKDILIIVDTSESMSESGRLKIVARAVDKLLSSLTFNDYFNVIQFSTNPNILIGTKMVRATTENRLKVYEMLMEIIPEGATNFESAFTAAFDLLKDSRPPYGEATSNCNTEIIFLTDGTITAGGNASVVIDLIAKRNSLLDHGPAIISAYSVGENADMVIPKQIACSTGGIWQEVRVESDLETYFSLENVYFSHGIMFSNLTTNTKNDVFWIETISDIEYPGITESKPVLIASTPVFDRSNYPPVLFGVVAVAVPREVVDPTNVTTIDLSAYYPVCKKFHLPYCTQQSIRVIVGEQSLCDQQCNNLTEITTSVCRYTLTPNETWCNMNRTQPTSDNVCCNDDICELTVICGNGIVEAGEACDDGNLVNHDGCDHLCSLEQYWICEGSPSHCFRPQVRLVDYGVIFGSLGGALVIIIILVIITIIIDRISANYDGKKKLDMQDVAINMVNQKKRSLKRTLTRDDSTSSESMLV